MPLASVAGAVLSSVLLHWSTSTLTDMCAVRVSRGWYNYSFLWLFEGAWRTLGIEMDSGHANLIALVTMYGVHFFVPLLGMVTFLMCSRLWTLKRLGWGALIAALCSTAYPIVGLVEKHIAFQYQYWMELAIMMTFLSLCIYVAAPRRFWITV
jgi:hypothetical protein